LIDLSDLDHALYNNYCDIISYSLTMMQLFACESENKLLCKLYFYEVDGIRPITLGE